MFDFNRIGQTMTWQENIIVKITTGYFLYDTPIAVNRKQTGYRTLHHVLCLGVTLPILYYRDVILQKWHKFLAHLSKVTLGYKKKKKSCKNPVAPFSRLPRGGCHRHYAGKMENFENFQKIVK